MKFLLALCSIALLAGCSSHPDDSALKAAPDAKLSAEQKIADIQNDPKVPDGLKQIQTDTLRAQPGVKR